MVGNTVADLKICILKGKFSAGGNLGEILSILTSLNTITSYPVFHSETTWQQFNDRQ